MKTDFYIEHCNKKILEKDVIDKVKEIWKEKGRLVKDLKTLDIYLKPEEHKCYYVFNSDETGSFNL